MLLAYLRQAFGAKFLEGWGVGQNNQLHFNREPDHNPDLVKIRRPFVTYR